MLSHIDRLHFFSDFGDEDIGILVAPMWEDDVVYHNLFLGLAVVVVVLVYVHLGERVDFGDEFSQVSWTRCCVGPRTTVTVEYSIGTVELTALHCYRPDTVRTNSDEKIE